MDAKVAPAPEVDVVDSTASPALIKAIARQQKKKQPMTTRMKIFEFFEDPEYSVAAKWYSAAMMFLIVLATTCFVLESEATVESGALHDTDALEVFQAIELVSVIIFTVEYAIRIACCPCENRGLIRFILTPGNVIDLLACVPFWITFAMEKISGHKGSGLGFVRVIRLIRVFRVFKFGKYSAGIQMFTGAIARSTQPLSILIFSLVLTVIIISSIMYMAEGQIADPDEEGYNPGLLKMAGVDEVSHMYCFGSIPRIFWWAVVTMTTVGFGDCFPVSTPGKMLAMMTMIMGVLILALPITVIGSNFQKMVEMYEEENSMLREFDVSEDGCIDEIELRAFLAAKRKDNALRRDIDLNPARLVIKYALSDESALSKTLNFEEFQLLKRDVIDPSSVDTQANIRAILKRIADHDQNFRTIQAQLNRMERLVCQQAGVAPPIHLSTSNGGSASALQPMSADDVGTDTPQPEPQPVPPPGSRPDDTPVRTRITTVPSSSSGG